MKMPGRGMQLLALGAMLLGAGVLRADGVTLPPAERIELDNGTVLILNVKRDVPMVGVHAVVRGGAVTDAAGRDGLATLAALLLEKGAGERSSAAFAEAVDSAGGTLSASAELEYISIAGDFLARDAALMVELLSDMLLRPRLDAAEFEKLRERSINFILAAKDSDPHALMPYYGHAALFGEHPYGDPVSGSEASLAAISHRDLLAWYEAQAGGDRLIVSVSGDFEAADMRERLTAAFGGWRAASAALPEVRPTAPETGRRVLLVDKPGATQTWFWIGNVGVARDYDARAALDLAHTVFGGRFTSMLNTALRVESGLTYGARSRLVRPSQPGSVAIDSYTRTDATVEAIDMALDVLGTLHAEGIPAGMLESAKNYVLGQFPTRLETATQLAEQFALLEAFGLTRSYVDGYGDAVRAVTPEATADVVDEVFPQGDDLLFVILGDAAAIRDAVTKYGPVTEMSITEPRFRPAESD